MARQVRGSSGVPTAFGTKTCNTFRGVRVISGGLGPFKGMCGSKKNSVKQQLNLNQESWIKWVERIKKNIKFRNVLLGHFASDCENENLPMWHFWPAIKKNKNTLEKFKNPRPASGRIEHPKSCTTSAMNFHMLYFSCIPQSDARLKLSCKFGESKCNPYWDIT